MSKILVAMSGGVDSTVTAYKLKEKGHDIQGVYMRLHNDEKSHEENIRKIKKVSEYLGISYHVLDIRDRFNEFVYMPFIKKYEEGLTPNPCALCNRNIKFGALIEFAKELGVDKLATGHYVQVVDGFIKEAVDKTKDQSYFLANVKKENLDFVTFPLGEMYKEDVKKFASQIDVLQEFATQKESSEICFVDTTYIDVLKKHTSTDKPGNVLNTKGEIVGEHKGYMHYTIGKRKGFSVKGALSPHYVISTNPQTNEIIVGDKDDLTMNSFVAKDVNMFINESKFECSVKIRYRSPKSRCIVNIKGNDAEILLHEPLQAIAAGQMAVFYDGDMVIGSAWIV
ncbi:MAG: tRNA 2-thiouridine(34) synthase MnmA [Sulfurospirillaceae bacterium]|nr:tRNA 2-thiouridine(34) synthase MnmA [Sulfurospirillaceae bacterium]